MNKEVNKEVNSDIFLENMKVQMKRVEVLVPLIQIEYRVSKEEAFSMAISDTIKYEREFKINDILK